jgi:hypothetical protein
MLLADSHEDGWGEGFGSRQSSAVGRGGRVAAARPGGRRQGRAAAVHGGIHVKPRRFEMARAERKAQAQPARCEALRQAYEADLSAFQAAAEA